MKVLNLVNPIVLCWTITFPIDLTNASNLRGCHKTGSDTCCLDSEVKEEVDLLIVGGTIMTMEENLGRSIKNGAIAIKDSIIVSLGVRSDIIKSYCSANLVTVEEYDIVMPGLINGHTHAPMSLMRSIASDQLTLNDWLTGYIFPAEKTTVNPRFCRVGTQLAMLEMIMTGTTTFVDMYYFEEDIAQVTADAGMRAILGQTIINFPVPDAETPMVALNRTRSFLDTWAGHPLVTAAVAPHAPNTLVTEYLQESAALAREYGSPILIHLAETKSEYDNIQESYGLTPVGYLHNIGFLGPDVIAAHSTYVNDGDLDIILESQTGIIHCPESDMKLGSGVMHVPKFLDMYGGVDANANTNAKMGLSTDGPASNDDLDMFEAMLIMSLVQKVISLDTTIISANDALRMATIGGARAIGLESKIGSIEVGKEADIIILDGNMPNMIPVYNIESLLVYGASGSNVRATIVAGQVLYLDGEFYTLDRDEIVAAARAEADVVRAAVGITKGD